MFYIWYCSYPGLLWPTSPPLNWWFIEKYFSWFSYLHWYMSASNKVSPQFELMASCLQIKMIDRSWSCGHHQSVAPPGYVWMRPEYPPVVVTIPLHCSPLLRSAEVKHWSPLTARHQTMIMSITWELGGDELSFIIWVAFCFGWGFVMTLADPDQHMELILIMMCVTRAEVRLWVRMGSELGILVENVGEYVTTREESGAGEAWPEEDDEECLTLLNYDCSDRIQTQVSMISCY